MGVVPAVGVVVVSGAVTGPGGRGGPWAVTGDRPRYPGAETLLTSKERQWKTGVSGHGARDGPVGCWNQTDPLDPMDPDDPRLVLGPFRRGPGSPVCKREVSTYQWYR